MVNLEGHNRISKILRPPVLTVVNELLIRVSSYITCVKGPKYVYEVEHINFLKYYLAVNLKFICQCSV